MKMNLIRKFTVFFIPSVVAFVHTSTTRIPILNPTQCHQSSQHSGLNFCIYYKDPSDKSDSISASGDSNANVWLVLANTERWISATLDRSNKAASACRAAEAAIAPAYERKKISYACEMGNNLAEVVGGIFRRVREARESGEIHGRDVEARLEDKSRSTTMRETNVVVIPNCGEISSFHTFDKLVQAINQARRLAKDLVLKKDVDDDDDIKDWVTSVTLAHLHPQYGMPLKQEEENEKLDTNIQAYKKERNEARRSPYPSVMIEVKATPAPDFDVGRYGGASNADGDDNVTSDDVKKLEALFSMSAAKKQSSVDDLSHDASEEPFGNDQVVSLIPLYRTCATVKS